MVKHGKKYNLLLNKATLYIVILHVKRYIQKHLTKKNIQVKKDFFSTSLLFPVDTSYLLF